MDPKNKRNKKNKKKRVKPRFMGDEYDPVEEMQSQDYFDTDESYYTDEW